MKLVGGTEEGQGQGQGEIEAGDPLWWLLNAAAEKRRKDLTSV